jgi:hypothetical protein
MEMVHGPVVALPTMRGAILHLSQVRGVEMDW